MAPIASCALPAMDYPEPGAMPQITVWHSDDLRRHHWSPPNCTGWSPNTETKLVLSMTGSFAFKGTANDLLARVGAISTLASIQYWSTTSGEWRHLIDNAVALNSALPNDRRKDFSASELKAPLIRHYWVHDTRLGDIVYAMRVKATDPKELIVLTENESAVRSFFVTLFAPSSLQSLVALNEQSPGVWRVYAVTRTGAGIGGLSIVSDRSFINRAVALYRHLSGIPTNLEQPAAP